MKLVRPCLDQLVAYEPGKSIESLQKGERQKGAIKLASNENAAGPSPRALKQIRESLATLHRYPDGNCLALKKELASRLGVKESMVVVGNGSDEIILLALRAFVDPGEEVVVAEPTFLIYALASKVAGAKVVPVPLRNLRYDLKGMREAVTEKTKIVFIANPDNPTGTFVHRTEVGKFMEDLPKHVLVFFDEAYHEFVEDKEYPDTRRYLNRHPVIITRSFSKAYGLAGLRIGYGMAPAELVSAVDLVREPFNVNSLAQAAAIAALEDRAHLERTRHLVWEGKRYLCRKLDRLGLRYVPSQTNFLLVYVGDAEAIYERLLSFGVIVREMGPWRLSGYLRVTIGTMSENRRFVHVLEKIMKEKESKRS